MKKRALPQNLVDWITARTRLRLSHAHVQMARELGMHPKKLGSKANHTQEAWKVPLADYIVDLYERRFGRREPENVVSIEDAFRAHTAKRDARKAERRASRAADQAASVDRALGFSARAEISLTDGAVQLVQRDPAVRLSDALLDLARVVDPKPTALPIDALTDLIDLVANVWNATLLPDAAERDAAREALAARYAGSEDVDLDRARAVLDAVAARKRERYDRDRRRVARTVVEARGGNYLVTAASLAYLDGDRRPL